MIIGCVFHLNTRDFEIAIYDKDGVAIGTYDGVIGKDNIISFENWSPLPRFKGRGGKVLCFDK